MPDRTGNRSRQESIKGSFSVDNITKSPQKTASTAVTRIAISNVGGHHKQYINNKHSDIQHIKQPKTTQTENAAACRKIVSWINGTLDIH